MNKYSSATEHVTLATYSKHAKVEDDDVEKDANTSVAQDEDVDIEMEDEEIPKAKAKQRKPKKVVPVGRNGLKKRRVMKSLKKIDEKGYMGKTLTACGIICID